MPEPSVAYFHKQFVPIGEARVSIRCKGLNYGLGCFEGIRAYWNEQRQQLFVFRPEEHYRRMTESCKILCTDLGHTVGELSDITCELLRRNEHKESVYIRPIMFYASELLSPTFVPGDGQLAMYTLVVQDYLNTAKGVTALVSSWLRVKDNMIPARAKPTAAYLNSALARAEAVHAGCDEAIMLTAEGYVSEGSAEHIFIVRDGVLITPSSQDDNLEGITRRTLVQAVPAELGRKVEQRRVNRTELYIAEEAFFCGTGAEITPVTRIDGRDVGNGGVGPITREIQELYSRIVHAGHEKYASWCVPVYK